jgi:hypothetical protein
MYLEKINNEIELNEAIKIAFINDTELLTKYHIVENGTYEHCVKDTFNKIIQSSKEHILEWYLIIKDSLIIGFTIVSIGYNYLYSFGINIKYRNNLILNEWFVKVKEILQNHFICELWEKNKRAINFLIKNGMEISNQENGVVTLKYN